MVHMYSENKRLSPTNVITHTHTHTTSINWFHRCYCVLYIVIPSSKLDVNEREKSGELLQIAKTGKFVHIASTTLILPLELETARVTFKILAIQINTVYIHLRLIQRSVFDIYI